MEGLNCLRPVTEAYRSRSMAVHQGCWSKGTHITLVMWFAQHTKPPQEVVLLASGAGGGGGESGALGGGGSGGAMLQRILINLQIVRLVT